MKKFDNDKRPDWIVRYLSLLNWIVCSCLGGLLGYILCRLLGLL